MVEWVWVIRPYHQRTWPAVWKSPLQWADASSSSSGNFPEALKRPGVISAEGQKGEEMSPPSLFVCSKLRMLMVMDWECVWRAILESTITSVMTVDYCHWKYCHLKWHDRALSQRAGLWWRVAPCYLLALRWHRVDNHFLEWVGAHYFDSSPSCFLLKPPISAGECILQPSMGGCIHSQRVLIMCAKQLCHSLWPPMWES